jgi:hypothetical protein
MGDGTAGVCMGHVCISVILAAKDIEGVSLINSDFN